MEQRKGRRDQPSLQKNSRPPEQDSLLQEGDYKVLYLLYLMTSFQKTKDGDGRILTPQCRGLTENTLTKGLWLRSPWMSCSDVMSLPHMRRSLHLCGFLQRSSQGNILQAQIEGSCEILTSILQSMRSPKKYMLRNCYKPEMAKESS